MGFLRCAVECSPHFGEDYGMATTTKPPDFRWLLLPYAIIALVIPIIAAIAIWAPAPVTFYRGLREGNVPMMEERLQAEPWRLEEKIGRGGLTPLQVAVTNNRAEVLEFLIGKGADTSVLYRVSLDERYTLMHLAARASHYDGLRVLVKYGADVNAMTERGRTPMDVAGESCGCGPIVDYLRSIGGVSGQELRASSHP